MSTLKSLALSLVAVAAFAAPIAVLADATPWWCNTPFGAWWGIQNCTISNGQSGVLVYVAVTNSQNAPATSPADFAVSVAGQSPSPATFAGSINGSPVILMPGSYNVSIPDTHGYQATYSVGCSGTISAGQYQLCTVTLSSVGSGYAPVTPYPYPYTNQPLVCTPATQTVSLGGLGHFEAVGGKGAYFWNTASRSYLNVGPVLNASFAVAGAQTVTVTSAGETATCLVNVVPTPGYGASTNGGAGTSYSNTVYSNPNNVTYTAAYSAAGAYPTLPNTGFEPKNAAGVAFAIVLLIGSAVALTPYAKKAFAVVTR